MTHILRIDASARNEGSTTRPLADQLVNSLVEQGYGATVTRRDLNTAPPALLTESWIGANSTDEAARSDDLNAVPYRTEETNSAAARSSRTVLVYDGNDSLFKKKNISINL